MSDFPVRCAAILAGGLSSRMGREKALIEVEGQTLVARSAALLRPLFPDLVVVTASPTAQQSAGIPAITDQFDQRGPLGGIHAALSHFQAPTFIVACDMPFLQDDFIRFMVGQWGQCDILIPESEEGSEPLHAIYSPTCLPVFERYLHLERPPSMRRVFSELQVQRVFVELAREFAEPVRIFENWNSPDDVKTNISGDSS